MTQAPELPPLHMRRDAFDPTPELREIRETDGVRTVVNAFGMKVFLVTRHDDIKDVLSDHERFVEPPAAGFRSCPARRDVAEEEQASRAGRQPAGPRPTGASAAAAHAHRPSSRSGRMKRLEPRIAEIVDAAPGRDGKDRAARGSGGELRRCRSRRW